MCIIKKLDPVFKISFIVMVLSFLWAPLDITVINSIDFKVISILFSLMLVIENLKETNLFNFISKYVVDKFKTTRKIAIILIILSFFSSMLITNDVALITIVPFTILSLKDIKSKNSFIDIIILETIAANLGSQFTPIGNPQNLYVYSYFNLNIIEFFVHMIFPSIISFVFVFIFYFFIKDEILENNFNYYVIEIDKTKTYIWGIGFFLCVFSVVDIIDYKYIFIVLLVIAAISNRKVIFKIDYSIIFTFICLFIFVHNLLQHNYIKNDIVPVLQTNLYGSAIILSQFISNVPATMLLAPLTDDWKTLLYAVNVSGLGTLVASMASIISYKLFIKEKPNHKIMYIIRFSVYNFVLLIILSIILNIIL